MFDEIAASLEPAIEPSEKPAFEPESQEQVEQGKEDAKVEPEAKNLEPTEPKEEVKPTEEAVVEPVLEEDDDIEAYMKNVHGAAEPKEEAPVEQPKAEEVKPEEEVAPAVPNPDQELLDGMKQLFGEDSFKWLVEAKLQGKNLIEELAGIAAQDPDKLSDADIVRMAAQKEGLSEDDIELEMEAFEGKSPFERKKYAEQFRKELREERAKKLELLKPAQIQPQDNSEQAKQVYEKATAELNAWKSKSINSDYLGMELTEERVKKIENYVNTEAPHIFRQDGSFDIEEMVDYAAYKLFKQDIIRSNIVKYKNSTKKELLKERLQPANTSTSQSISLTSSSDLDEAVNEFLGKKK